MGYYRILLVDDEEEVRKGILRKMDWEKLGFQVAGDAENGEEAVRAFEASPEGFFAAILMDAQMPVMDGWQAAQAIRALANPALAAIPIVALSANVFQSDINKSLDSGMEAHLTKPIDVARFMEEVHRAIRRHGISEKNS